MSATGPQHRFADSPRRLLELVWFQSYAALRAEREQTFFGFFWWFIEPVVTMAIFYFVFSYVLDRGTENYVAFLLIGLVLWKWFGEAFSRGGNAIIANAGLLRRVHIPKFLLPLISIATDTFKFAVALVLLLAFLWIDGYEIHAAYAAIPAIVVTELLFICGSTVFLCSITPFLPDIKLLLDNLLRALFFVSGIFFPLSMVPPEIREYLLLNPMAILIEAFRQVALEGQWPAWEALGCVCGASVFLGLLGLAILKRNDREYEKYLT